MATNPTFDFDMGQRVKVTGNNLNAYGDVVQRLETFEGHPNQYLIHYEDPHRGLLPGWFTAEDLEDATPPKTAARRK